MSESEFVLDRIAGGKNRAERAKWDARYEKLQRAILKYDPSFDFGLLKEAIEWVPEETLKPNGGQPLSDRRQQKKVKRAAAAAIAAAADSFFSDSLTTVEQLVKHTQANARCILAAVLYPSVSPRGGRGLDLYKLDEIESKFGQPVRVLVERIVHFRALNLYEGMDEERFLYMSMWQAEEDDAIRAGAVQNLTNLMREAKKPGTFPPETLERMLLNAEKVYVPLLHLIGDEELEKKLDNMWFRVKMPKEYAETKAAIERVVGKLPSDELHDEDDSKKDDSRKEDSKKSAGTIDTKALVDRLAAHIEKENGWIRDFHFTMETRIKDVYGAYKTSQRKKIPVEKVGDLIGIRAILEMPVIGEWAAEHRLPLDIDKIGQRALPELGRKCLLVYNRGSRKFGRGNTQKINKRPVRDENGRPVFNEDGSQKFEFYSYIQEKFARFAIDEPILQSKIYRENPEAVLEEIREYKHRDSRLSISIKRPRKKGYSGAHDTIFLPLDGHDEPVEVEWQIMDRVRWRTNEFGMPAGHRIFKLNINEFDPVRDYFRKGRVEATGRRYGGKHWVYVADDKNRIFDITNDPTVGGFLHAAQEVGSHEAVITDGYALLDTERRYSTGNPLHNGCYVAPVRQSGTPAFA
ncbi:MAG: hypothetical protein P4M15_10345 [Alphaproteobacteria bacterium]|nr:hypothetical protein [Alphaproteobacteria bacterium]